MSTDLLFGVAVTAVIVNTVTNNQINVRPAHHGAEHTRSPLDALISARGIRRAGRTLHRAVWSEPVFATLTPLTCGWMDGGCLLLAQALTSTIKTYPCHVYGIIDPPKHPTLLQHAVCATTVSGRLWFLDADGASTADELLDRWRTEEQLTAPTLVSFETVTVSEGTPSDETTITRIAAALTVALAARDGRR